MSDQHLIGTEADDFLVAGDGNDLLESLGGSDTLIGGQGDDVYVVQAGGTDAVWEWIGDDEVHWTGVSASQVEVIRPTSSGYPFPQPNYDLVLRIAGTTDTLTISGYFYDQSNTVERVVFD